MGFASFLGNSGAVNAVRDLLASGRVPGALLFSGPDGVGKKTLAFMLAKALNCERREPAGNDFCGECARCRKVEGMFAAARDDLTRRREIKDAQRRVNGLVYFDVQLIEPITRYILMEQVREVRNVAYARPFELPRRIIILDQAQAIHWQAADLLLKMLEEPPDTTTFVLVCPNPHELRPTIRSRCLRVQFVPVEESVVSDLLERERQVPKAKRLLATRVTAGSVSRARAFSLADFERRRQPWLDFLGSALGRGPRSEVAPDWKALFDSTRALTEDREGLDETLRIGYTLLRDLLLILEGGRESELVNVDLVDRLNSWASEMGLAGVETMKAGLDQAYRLQTRNVNQQLGLDAMAVDLVAALGREEV